MSSVCIEKRKPQKYQPKFHFNSIQYSVTGNSVSSIFTSIQAYTFKCANLDIVLLEDQRFRCTGLPVTKVNLAKRTVVPYALSYQFNCVQSVNLATSRQKWIPIPYEDWPHSNAGFTLGQGLRRCTNVNPTLEQQCDLTWPNWCVTESMSYLIAPRHLILFGGDENGCFMRSDETLKELLMLQISLGRLYGI